MSSRADGINGIKSVRKIKFVSAGSRNQHASSLCSPEFIRTPRRSVAAITSVYQKGSSFLEHFVEFFGSHFSNRVKDHVLFDSEKSLRTDKARVTDFATLAIALI